MQVVHSYIGSDHIRGEGIADHGGEPHVDVLQRSPFSVIEQQHISVERRWTPERVVGHLHTAPWATPAHFGNRLQNFTHDVQQALEPFIDEHDELIEPVKIEVLIAKREGVQ